MADVIINYRNQLENQEFSSKDQLIDVIGEDNYKRVKDFITTRSWVDNKAVIPAEEITGGDPYSTIGNLPSISYQLSNRSPININTASKEVLMTIIKGVGGRTVYTYNDVNLTQDRQIIDSQSTKWKIAASAGQRYEEKRTKVNSMYLWIEPFDLNEADLLAEAIIKYRANNAFDNFYELNLFLEKQFRGNIFSGYWQRVRSIAKQRMNNEYRDSGNARNPFSSSSMNTVLENIYRNAAADCLKANFNPNATVTFYNANQAAARVVDKANLLYMPAGKQGPSYLPVEVRQTCDVCFNPMGIFEITSLGQVKSDDRVEAEAKLRTIIWVYDAVRHTTQQDFEKNSEVFKGFQYRADVVTYPEPSTNWTVNPNGLYVAHNKGGLPSGNTQRDADKTVIDGRVELAAAEDSTGRGINNSTFSLTWKDRNDKPSQSNYFADKKGNKKENWLYAYETLDFEADEAIRENASVQKSNGNLMPDGFYNTMFSSQSSVGFGGYRPRYLWYRAGYEDPTPTLPYTRKNNTQVIEQGEYSPGKNAGVEPNIDYYGGVIEFWYKPDKSWQHWELSGSRQMPLRNSAVYYNQGALDIFMGFLFVSHVREKKQPDAKGNRSKSTGTQLFMYRNSFGDLRATRIYYEIIGEDPNEPGAQDEFMEKPFIRYQPVSDKAKKYGEPKYFSDNIILGLKEYVKAYENDPVTNQGTYKWPPDEIGAVTAGQLDSRIKRGRSDCIIYAERLRFIRANEWHHFTIGWDDSTTSPTNRLFITVDNGSIRSVPLPRTDEKGFEGTFSKCNEIPDKNRDHIYVGSIFRKQYYIESGVFKFTSGTNMVKEVCHGTIDDFHYFPLSRAGGRGIPQRYVTSGVYTNGFDLRDRFSGGVQQIQLGALSYTAYLPRDWSSTMTHRWSSPPELRLTLKRMTYDPSSKSLSGGANIPIPGNLATFNQGNVNRGGNIALVDGNSKPVAIGPNEWVVYTFEMTSATPSGTAVRSVASPVLDDITLTFFLPQPRILLETSVTK